MPVSVPQDISGRQRIGAFDLDEIAGSSVGAPPGRFDLLRGRREALGTAEPGTNGRDSIVGSLAGVGDPSASSGW